MPTQPAVFTYTTLRTFVGLVALSLPILVTLVARQDLESISASYYTHARNIFVGFLFVVGSFLLAYEGHTPRQAKLSKVAALAAVCVALFPTAAGQESTTNSIIHYVAAACLFSILTVFCFIFFRKDTQGKAGGKGRRSKVYFSCGVIMSLCMIGLVLNLLEVFGDIPNIVYWLESFALYAFGVAWIVSGKMVPYLKNDQP